MFANQQYGAGVQSSAGASPWHGAKGRTREVWAAECDRAGGEVRSFDIASDWTAPPLVGEHTEAISKDWLGKK